MPYTQEYVDRMERAIRELKFQRKVFMVVNIIAALSVAGIVVLWINQRNSIQKARYLTVLNNCEDQNTRRARTIGELNVIISKLPPDKRAAAEISKGNTILLINTLAPHQNCAKVADRAIHPPRTLPN